MKQVLVQATMSVDQALFGAGQTAAARKEWISVAEAAAILGCSDTHIRTLCNQGKLRFKRFGKFYRIPASELAVPEQAVVVSQEQQVAPSGQPDATSSPDPEFEQPRRRRSIAAPRTPEEARRYETLREARRRLREEFRRERIHPRG
jgi:excisionase family DNA binding protein